MKKLHMLLGCAERRINSSVEMCVLDTCYNVATVETTKVVHLGQFVRHSCLSSFDILVLVPDCLLPETNRTDAIASVSVSAVRALRAQCSAPLMVLSTAVRDYSALIDAGADSVLSTVFKPDVLKSEVRRLLGFVEPATPKEPEGWSLAWLLWRTVQRLNRA